MFNGQWSMVNSQWSMVIMDCELKPLHAQWIVDTYNYMQTQKELIVKGFDKAGILDAIVHANNIMVKCENPFKDNGLL